MKTINGKMVYEQKDLDTKIMGHIARAKEIVETTIFEKNIKDTGTCVGGNGIQIYFLPKGARKNYVGKIIVNGPFQGNVSNYEALKPALEYLRNQGIECRYEDGWMD